MFGNVFQKSGFQIREAVPVGLGFWLLGTFGGGFQWNKDVFGIYYTNKNLYCPSHSYWGMGWDGCRWGTLDDMFYK